MADVVALLSIFVFFPAILAYFSYKKKRLAAASKSNPKELEAVRAERKQLEARVQNLESIVCSVEFELNARLNRLATQESAVGHLSEVAAKPRVLAAVGGGDLATAKTAVAQPVPISSSIGAGQRVAGRYVLERELGR